MAVGFAMSLHNALQQSDRVIFNIDGEILEVRRSHAKADIQRVLARLLPPHAGQKSAPADQNRQLRH
jgi:hypothetical protein